MTHLLNIAILEEDKCDAFKQIFIANNNAKGLDWLKNNSHYFSIGMYKEILGTFCTCFNKEIFERLNIPLKESQYYWIFNYDQKDTIMQIFENFIESHTKEILNGITDLVHNQQVYVNTTSIDNLSMSIDKAKRFIENYTEEQIVILLPTRKFDDIEKNGS